MEAPPAPKHPHWLKPSLHHIPSILKAKDTLPPHALKLLHPLLILNNKLIKQFLTHNSNSNHHNIRRATIQLSLKLLRMYILKLLLLKLYTPLNTNPISPLPTRLKAHSLNLNINLMFPNPLLVLLCNLLHT